MNLPKFIFLSVIYILSLEIIVGQGQNFYPNKSNSSWTKNPFEQFVFIENKGQFDNKKSEINYYANSKGVDVYFSKSGFEYRYDEYITNKSGIETEGSERDEEGKEKNNTKVLHHSLQLEWIGSNSNTTIVGDEAQTFYYTYPNIADNGQTTIKAGCYKKIIYKNLYPNIDAEYILPEKGGVKYSLLLHPGADLSQVNMRYKNAKGIHLDEMGNIIIQTEFGAFADHSPVSFYAPDGTSAEGIPIGSAFVLKGNTVSFSLNNVTPLQSTTIYPTPSIIIDPWITNPQFLSSNSAYDINYDLQGNVYAYGSTKPFKLAKFDNAGNLIWVFNAVGFGIDNGVYTYGDFAVDEYTGTSYLGEAWVVGNARVIKVNTSGFQTGTFGGTNNMSEIWRMEYNRCINKVLIVGGGSPVDAVAVDTNMTNFTPVNMFNTTSTNRDFQFLAVDNSNGFCYMAMGINGPFAGAPDNIMIKCPIPNLLPTAFSVPTRHRIAELQSIQYHYAPHMNGMNGMAVSPNWLYTYDSDTLRRWNKNTGAFISAIHVSTTAAVFNASNYIQIYWGGLSVDECDNIYIGNKASLKIYNSSLNLISTIALPDTVYDVKLGPNNKLYVCGRHFVQELNTTANNTTVTVTQTPASGCNTCNGTASVSSVSCGGNGSGFSYKWNTIPVQTNQTATGLCPGNYTVTLTTSCSITFTGTITVGGGPGTISATISSSPATCINNDGTATANPTGSSGIYTYSWSNGQTAQTVSGLSANTYSVTVTDGTCTATTTVSITKPLSVASITSANLPCNSGGNATITINASTGGPYTYSWSNGGTTISGSTTNKSPDLPAGTYTVTVKDNAGCILSQSITIPNLLFNISVQSQNITCNQSGSGAVTVNSGVGPFIFKLSNGLNGSSYSGLAPGTYTVTATDGGGCTTTKTFTISSSGTANAAFTQSPAGIVCIGATVNFTHVGSAGTHNWALSPSSISSGTTTNFSFTFLSSGTYTIIHDITNGSCKNTVISQIIVNNCTGLNVTTIGSSVCAGSCASVTSSGSGGASPYTFTWSNGGTTQNINPCPVSTTTYTVTIRDSGGNTSTSTAMVTVNPAVTVSVSPINITCSGTSTGSATAAGSSGSSPYTYNWNTGVSGSAASGLSAGTYTVTVTDNKGCSSISTSTILSPQPLIGQFTKGNANCTGCGCKEWLMVNATGGTSPYSFTWPDGYISRYKNQLCQGAYTINIKDKNGCSINMNLTTP